MRIFENKPLPSLGHVYSWKRGVGLFLGGYSTTDVLSLADALIYIAKSLVIVVVMF